VIGRLGLGRVGIAGPCRVVWARQDETTIGFGYGTLPGHPECGEEAFVVTRADDGSVLLDIPAFSRPAACYARAAGPLGHLLQSIVTDLYVRAGRSVCPGPAVRPGAGSDSVWHFIGVPFRATRMYRTRSHLARTRVR